MGSGGLCLCAGPQRALRPGGRRGFLGRCTLAYLRPPSALLLRLPVLQQRPALHSSPPASVELPLRSFLCCLRDFWI